MSNPNMWLFTLETDIRFHRSSPSMVPEGVSEMQKRRSLLHVVQGVAACVLCVALISCEEMMEPPPPDTAPGFSRNVPDQTYTAGTAISPLTLPSAIGGNGSLRYSLTPTVPGLSFDRRTRTLSGTPANAGVHRMTYRVEDSDGNSSASDADTVRFTITVEPAPVPPPQDTAPGFSRNVPDQTYTAGTPITPLILPSAVGGNGVLRYSLTPTVPGLSFDGPTRTLSGTPSTAGVYRMTYRVEDSDDNFSASDADTVAFNITIDPQVVTEAVIETVVSSVSVGNAVGVLKTEQLPISSGGPDVSVSGNHSVISGGTFFIDVEPASGSTLDKLLISFAGENFGYYEVDLQEITPTYRIVGEMSNDVDPGALQSFGLLVVAVDQQQAVGRPVNHDFNLIEVGVGDVQVSLSWDVDSDVDLHVVDPNGDELYYGQKRVSSGGELDLDSNAACRIDGVRNENVTWPEGTAPPGLYTVRVDYWSSCGVAETNYVVTVNNGGHVSRFPGSLTGAGERGGRGSGQVVTTFTVPGTAPPGEDEASCSYRGSGDQVCAVPYSAQPIDYTIELGQTRPEVYVIATNTTSGSITPRIVRRSTIEAAAKRLPVLDGKDLQQPDPRLSISEGGYDHPVRGKPWVTEFNATPPPLLSGGAHEESRQQQTQSPVAVGSTFTFKLYEEFSPVVNVPATARSVVTDGVITLAVWVADDQWGTVRQTMVDAIAHRFLRIGSNNDIYDWVTTIFGKPWGPHTYTNLISQSAANQIHILLFDINNDGAEGTVGYFFTLNNYLQDPSDRALATSSERLLFYLDAPTLAQSEGPSWEVTDPFPSVMVATLAHEFQHMIHFYQKNIIRDVRSETWLNEMASEVTEDLIADKTMVNGPRGVAYGDATAGSPGITSGRLPRYNDYNDIRVTTWDNDLANYSINYAIGAYLARAYGGAALFRSIVQNNGTGTDAIEAAANVSFGDVLVNWAVANLLSDNTAAPSPYRYNSGSWSTSQVGGTTFRLGSINLFNYRSATGGTGPRFYSLAQLSQRVQPPHSNRYATLGRNTGTLRLVVTAVAGNRITVVVKE